MFPLASARDKSFETLCFRVPQQHNVNAGVSWVIGQVVMFAVYEGVIAEQ